MLKRLATGVWRAFLGLSPRARWVIAGVLVLGALSLIGNVTGAGEDVGTQPETTTEPPATAQSPPAITPQPPVFPPSSPKPLTAREALFERIREALGKRTIRTDRGIKRIQDFVALKGGRIYVKWAIEENLTEGLTKDSARLDVLNLLKAIRASGFPFKNVFLQGTFPLKDIYGRVSEELVYQLSFTRKTIDRVVFENVYFKDVDKIADSIQIHAAFQY